MNTNLQYHTQEFEKAKKELYDKVKGLFMLVEFSELIGMLCANLTDIAERLDRESDLTEEEKAQNGETRTEYVSETIYSVSNAMFHIAEIYETFEHAKFHRCKIADLNPEQTLKQF